MDSWCGRNCGEEVGNVQIMDYVMLDSEQLEASISIWGHDRVMGYQIEE